jgi:hypothetical protein
MFWVPVLLQPVYRMPNDVSPPIWEGKGDGKRRAGGMARFPSRPFCAIMRSAQSLAAEQSGLFRSEAAERQIRPEP